MTNKRKSLRFGLIINDIKIEQWQYDCVASLLGAGMKLCLVIHSKDEEKIISARKRIRNGLKSLSIYRFWNSFIFNPRSKFKSDLNEISKDAHYIFCTLKSTAETSYFNETDIQEIRNQNLDFILHFGTENLKGDVLNTTKYGLWTFYFGSHKNANSLSGFNEFMNKEYVNRVSVGLLTNDNENISILKEIKLKTIIHSYKAHLEQLCYEASLLPHMICKDIISNVELQKLIYPKENSPKSLPSNYRMLIYFSKSFFRRIAFHINDLFRQEDWNVGYCEIDIEDFIDADKENLDIKWFKKPRKNCYFADPFVIKTEKDTYIFFEWYSYYDGKADLSVALKSEDFKIYHKISHFKEHRSYPYIFEHEGIIYCLPEAHQTNKLTLYRFNEKELRLEEDCILLEGFPIVDATLYKSDEIWYMFLVNQKKSHTHLEIYHSDTLKGPYIAHNNNPVIIDSSKARPAGKIFTYKGMQIRPSQNCTKHYGQSIALEDIISLSDKEFRHNYFGELNSITGSDYDKGIHTINSDIGITVFDGKRFVFTLSGLKQQFKQKIVSK